MKRPKIYFENEDANMAHSEEWFQDLMKEEGLTEMTVMEAIRIPHYKAEFVWCKDADDACEKSECNKRNCESYKPKNGKNGRCINVGQYCDFGDNVVLKLKV